MIKPETNNDLMIKAENLPAVSTVPESKISNRSNIFKVESENKGVIEKNIVPKPPVKINSSVVPNISDKNTSSWLKKNPRIRLDKTKRKKSWNFFWSVVGYPIIGIDISDYSIEILYLNKQKRIVSSARSLLPEGVVVNGDIINQKALIEILRSTLEQGKPDKISLESKANIKAVVSLPDNKTYLQQFVFKEGSNLIHQIEEKIKETVPLPFESVYWDFIKINDDNPETKVLVAVTAKDTVDNYIHFLRSTGITPITPIVFDVESMSVARALLKNTFEELEYKPNKKSLVKNISENIIILDIGAKTTTLNAYDQSGILCFSVSIQIGGSKLTEIIAKAFNLKQEEAENKKNSQGLVSAEIKEVLNETLKEFILELKTAMGYFSDTFGGKINKLILAGGTSLVPGLVEFFIENLSIPVEIGNPLSKIYSNIGNRKKEDVIYSNVIGLALRAISKNPITNGINLLPTAAKDREIKTRQEESKMILAVSIFFVTMSMFLLIGTLYFLVKLPVPVPIQPLKPRDLLRQSLESINQKQEFKTVVELKEEFVGKKIEVYQEPILDSKKEDLMIEESALELIEQNENWFKIKLLDKEVWVEEKYWQLTSSTTQANGAVIPKDLNEEKLPEMEALLPETKNEELNEELEP